jgi:hypothetical protein
MLDTDSLIQVPLGPEGHRLAKEFALEQEPPRRKQVYLNTLAVYAVYRYLQWLDVATDLSKSDSWNPAIRSYLDVADLWINEVEYKLECRPVLPEQTSIVLPEAARHDRIGCVAVQFAEELDYATLLGFVRYDQTLTAPQAEIPLTKLQPWEEFPGYLEWVKDEMPADLTAAQEADTAPELPFINVAALLAGYLDEEAEKQGLQPLFLSRTLGHSTTGIDAMLEDVSAVSGIKIPLECKPFGKNIDFNNIALQLCVFLWQPESQQQWSLLLLLREVTGQLLPKGLHLEIKKRYEVLQDSILESPEKYFGGYVEGSLADKFFVTVSLEGEKIPLLPFAFPD